ncbi:MAG: type I-C CRISPR-associated protein Cas8c/Csd1 [Clostridiales bacterium]|nr:type I-C CRISPR-associated protein Cas8c/Csd1 [Clostridiales bacterium]
MLKALYDYAGRHALALPVGYANKDIKGYISLSATGALLGVVMDGKAVPCPDIGALAHSTEKSNVLAEKRGVVLPKAPTAKSRFFLDALKSGAQAEPMLAVCAAAIEDPATAAQIQEELDRHGIKNADRISFQVDGKSILESPKIAAWWTDFRLQFRTAQDRPTSVCLITGQPVTPTATTPPIKGLLAVGGHPSGDALICFDKAAFCSYGLKQGANAPVSEEAFAAVKAALEHLLEGAPTLAGMKFVHWYDRPIPPEEDPLQTGDLFGGESLSLEMDEDDGQPDEETPEERAQRERGARRGADQVVESVYSGEQARVLQNVYHILLLTGVSGRVMIRRYERGSYEALKQNLERWQEDLQLTNAFGTADIKSCKLNARLFRLLSHQKVDKDPFRRLGRELSGLTEAIVASILNGTALPEPVGARALAYVRAQMFAAGTEGETKSRTVPVPDGRACQWLKVWLLRKERNKGGEKLMERYNLEHPEPAYHCGGLMAVYAAIQKMAMPDVNAGVVQRYYGAASQTPALVLGRLNQLSMHHLEKLRSTILAEGYAKHLARLYTALQDNIPPVLNLEQQAYFALGYYQLWAVIKGEEAAYFASKKQKDKQPGQEDGEPASEMVN